MVMACHGHAASRATVRSNYVRRAGHCTAGSPSIHPHLEGTLGELPVRSSRWPRVMRSPLPNGGRRQARWLRLVCHAPQRSGRVRRRLKRVPDPEARRGNVAPSVEPRRQWPSGCRPPNGDSRGWPGYRWVAGYNDHRTHDAFGECCLPDAPGPPEGSNVSWLTGRGDLRQ